MNAATRKWRAAHPDKIAAYAKRRLGIASAYIDSLKVGGCVDCGTKNLTVLDFDHVRGTKERGVSEMWSRPWAVIDAEAAKCEVRCANCHRITTAARKRVA